MKNESVILTHEFFQDYLDKFERRYEKVVFERQEDNKIHNTVEWGNWVYESLINNDTEEMLKALQMIKDNYQPGNLSCDQLRSRKNLAISLISAIANLAARDRLVENELVLNVADICIIMCEETKTNEELLKCTYAGLFKICSLMKDYRERSYHPIVRECKDSVYQHLHGEIKIQDIAHFLNVTPEHLSRTFHKSEGIALKQYILNERIQRAKNLLRYSNYTVTEIASYLAFSSPSHFGNVFKAKVGKTPSNYRKSFPHLSN